MWCRFSHIAWAVFAWCRFSQLSLEPTSWVAGLVSIDCANVRWCRFSHIAWAIFTWRRFSQLSLEPTSWVAGLVSIAWDFGMYVTVASTCWIVNEWQNGEAVEGGSRDIFRVLSGVSLRGTEQNRRNQNIFNIAAKSQSRSVSSKGRSVIS